jgi:hypothetical protein
LDQPLRDLLLMISCNEGWTGIPKERVGL